VWEPGPLNRASIKVLFEGCEKDMDDIEEQLMPAKPGHMFRALGEVGPKCLV
jgi:hypothetical protein